MEVVSSFALFVCVLPAQREIRSSRAHISRQGAKAAKDREVKSGYSQRCDVLDLTSKLLINSSRFEKESVR